METALISLVCVAIILMGTVTTIMTSFQAASTVTESLKEMEEQAADIRRTEINAVDNDNTGGGDFYITVENEGQTNLSRFAKWDVIAQYERGGTDYLTYLEYTTDADPGNNQWSVDGIYVLNKDPEVLDPGILNPGETMELLIELDPGLSIGDNGRITVSTPNGVTSQALIRRQ